MFIYGVDLQVSHSLLENSATFAEQGADGPMGDTSEPASEPAASHASCEQAIAASSRREGYIVGYINAGSLWQIDAGRSQPQSMNV
jgi:hypothetical protein